MKNNSPLIVRTFSLSLSQDKKDTGQKTAKSKIIISDLVKSEYYSMKMKKKKNRKKEAMHYGPPGLVFREKTFFHGSGQK